MPTKTVIEVPFDADGNQMDWGYGGVNEWRPNYVFEDTLTYAGYSRGNSSATLLFIDVKGRRYSMFLSCFDEALRTRGMRGTMLEGPWTFQKRGQNYSLCLAPEGSTSSGDRDTNQD